MGNSGYNKIVRFASVSIVEDQLLSAVALVTLFDKEELKELAGVINGRIIDTPTDPEDLKMNKLFEICVKYIQFLIDDYNGEITNGRQAG